MRLAVAVAAVALAALAAGSASAVAGRVPVPVERAVTRSCVSSAQPPFGAVPAAKLAQVSVVVSRYCECSLVALERRLNVPELVALAGGRRLDAAARRKLSVAVAPCLATFKAQVRAVLAGA